MRLSWKCHLRAQPFCGPRVTLRSVNSIWCASSRVHWWLMVESIEWHRPSPLFHSKSLSYLRQPDSVLDSSTEGEIPMTQYIPGGQQDHKGWRHRRGLIFHDQVGKPRGDGVPGQFVQELSWLLECWQKWSNLTWQTTLKKNPQLVV